jgi:hypothetical protein
MPNRLLLLLTVCHLSLLALPATAQEANSTLEQSAEIKQSIISAIATGSGTASIIINDSDGRATQQKQVVKMVNSAVTVVSSGGGRAELKFNNSRSQASK